MANTNRFQGLHRGPIDHKSSSVINQIANGAIDMGSVVALTTTINLLNTLSRVEETTFAGDPLVYGIAVGGDIDGVYGNGSVSIDDSTRATNAAGQGVVVVTQGRCLARVGVISAPILIGDPLTSSGIRGVLEKAFSGDTVIAIALNRAVNTGDTDMIAVDVQRQGLL